jgi:hypothetical protein
MMIPNFGGMTILKATLIALVTAMNNSATEQIIGIKVQGEIATTATWNDYFNESNCIGLPAVKGVTTGIPMVQDVTALVTNSSQTYGFRMQITQENAASVRYTTQYVLLLYVEAPAP